VGPALEAARTLGRHGNDLPLAPQELETCGVRRRQTRTRHEGDRRPHCVAAAVADVERLGIGTSCT
jgi:predicted Zn-ribbon and HTH transcriptional regulator